MSPRPWLGRAAAEVSAPRLVLDTNVLVSALLFSTGPISWLREAWQSLVVVPIASRDTTSELLRVLHYPKFHLTADECEDLLAGYLPWCDAVTVFEPPAVPDCRDPCDRPFLELALAGRADALVTGDGDLLALAPVFPIPILTPRAAKDWIHG